MRIRLSLLQLLFVLFGISHCEDIRGSVLYENALTGRSYDITANAGAGYGLYSVFPFYGGSGNLFPATSYYTLTAPIAYLRVKRLSGVACNVPTNVTLASEQGNSLGVVGIGTAVGEFCDFPVTGTSAGQKLSSVFICINNQCSGANGTLVLDGSIGNSGYAIDGTQTIKQPGGWAFQVCDNNGCSGGFTACPVPPINPITDPVAIQFENGNTLDTTHLSSAMQTANNSFRNAVTNNGGSFILNSAYRPPPYQVHLREVWDKWQLLKNCTLPACQTLRTQVQTEVNRHGISNLNTRPAGVCGFHTQGLAIDVAVNPAQTGLPLQTTLNLASQSGLYRRIAAKDPVHFELFPPQPLNCPPQLNGFDDETGVVEYSSANSQATQTVATANVLVTITKQFVNNNYVYSYGVQNNDPRPILAFEVGYNDSTNASQLLIPPVGWNYETGLAAGSTASPTDWSSNLITTEESEFHSIEWRTENPNQNIQPFQSMTGFSIVLPQEDDRYRTSSLRIVFADGNMASAIPATSVQLLLEASGPTSNQVAALDSVLFVRDPFPVVNGADLLNLGVDRNTRVIVFVMNLQLAQGETSSSVVVNLIDSNNQSYDLAAEDVRLVPNFDFTQVIFRLPDNLSAGTCTIKIKAHGQISNAGTMRIRI